MNQSATAVATGNNYASILKAKVPNWENITIVVGNSDDADDMTIEVLVSNDPQASAASFSALELNSDGDTELVIGEGTTKSFDLPLFHWIDVQAKSTSSGNPAKANVWLNTR